MQPRAIRETGGPSAPSSCVGIFADVDAVEMDVELVVVSVKVGFPFDYMC